MRAPSAAFAPSVAEVQGLYGAFSFPEKLLQKIWMRGDFDRAGAVLMDGRRVRIAYPGKWNLLGGPDFSAARLRLGEERETIGDVELHLRAEDWAAHQHARDPAYDRVILHVVLFPPAADHVTRGADGRAIPVLALLPLLHRALEEYAADEAVETLANRPLSRLPDELGTLPQRELMSLIERHAAARWAQKVRFAKLRIEKLGWEGACHHAALEILGYRFNRAPMLRIAGQWRLAAWAAGQIVPEEVYAAEADNGGWSLQGVRPANHPRARLRQYAAWTAARPDWPAHLLAESATWPEIGAGQGATGGPASRGETPRPQEGPPPHREIPVARDPLSLNTSSASSIETGALRRVHQFSTLREALADRICGGAIGGTRLDNLACDGMFPLLAARTGRDFRGLWHHWFVGDLPPMLAGGLRQLGLFDGRKRPACHGAAQGLLGWLLEREPRQ